MNTIRSEDAKLNYLYQKTLHNSGDAKVQLDFMEELNHRVRVDHEFKSFERALNIVNGNIDDIDFDCMRSLIEHYEKHCAPFDEYVMTNTKSFVKACNTKNDMDSIFKALDNACAH